MTNVTPLRPAGVGHNRAPSVRVLEVFFGRDTGLTEAASLFLEVDGKGVDLILRAAVPIDRPRDPHLRLALARTAEALMELARTGVQEE